MRKPFEISTGAWWVVADGRTIAVPSFHESWLASHPGIAGGALIQSILWKKVAGYR